jgi:hypothetical protein
MSPVEFSVEIRPIPLYLLIGPLKQIPIGYWFNGKLRHELLDREIFYPLTEAHP